MSKQIHVPMRMCAVTREKLPKKELLRFVLIPDTKEVKLDKWERLRGRGLNMKPDLGVFDKGVKIKLFNRVFGVQMTQQQIQSLRTQTEEWILEKFTKHNVVRVSKETLDKLIKDTNE